MLPSQPALAWNTAPTITATSLTHITSHNTYGFTNRPVVHCFTDRTTGHTTEETEERGFLGCGALWVYYKPMFRGTCRLHLQG
jgi:hypothetical protein